MIQGSSSGCISGAWSVIQNLKLCTRCCPRICTPAYASHKRIQKINILGACKSSSEFLQANVGLAAEVSLAGVATEILKVTTSTCS